MKISKLFFTFLVVTPAFANSGEIDGGGGSGYHLSRYVDNDQSYFSDSKGFYRESFRDRAERGLRKLRHLVEQGYRFQHKNGTLAHLTEFHIDAAETIVDDLLDSRDGRGLSLNPELVDRDGNPLIAVNYRSGDVALNPVEWSSHRWIVQEVIAVHEILSLPPLNLEETGSYPFSMAILSVRTESGISRANAHAKDLVEGLLEPWLTEDDVVALYPSEEDKRALKEAQLKMAEAISCINNRRTICREDGTTVYNRAMGAAQRVLFSVKSTQRERKLAERLVDSATAYKLSNILDR